MNIRRSNIERIQSNKAVNPIKEWPTCAYLKASFWTLPLAFLGWIWGEIMDAVAFLPKIDQEDSKDLSAIGTTSLNFDDSRRCGTTPSVLLYETQKTS